MMNKPHTPQTALIDLPNPFFRQTVDRPRDLPATAESIYQTELSQLIGVFRQLASQPVPRLRPGPLAVLVLSQMQGSGKSHLLGRLWSRLQGHATLIFVRAHQDKQAFWRRIQERLVLELEHPDDRASPQATATAATQLDRLARYLLADLLEHGSQAGKVNTSAVFVKVLRGGGDAAIDKIRQQLPKLLGLLDQLVSVWIQQLTAARIQLERNPAAWLKVLIHYTIHPPGHPLRSLALEWLQGNDLDPQDAQKLGMTASQCRIRPEGEASEDSLNETAFQCVKDLCALSAFFRPVVFAFDQTEMYGDSPTLARTFGATVARLQAECINQFTVVTGNHLVWFNKVFAHFEKADQERFDSRLALSLKGIDLSQAQELVTVKLRSAGFPDSAVQDFLNQPWLSRMFSGLNQRRHTPRNVEIAACQALEDWRHGRTSNSTEEVDPASTELSPPERLAQAFEQHKTKLLTTHKALDFDVGVLKWVLHTGVSAVKGLKVHDISQQAKDRLHLRWQIEQRVMLLALDTSTNFKHWMSVGKAYQQLAQQEQSQGLAVQAAVLRHRSLRPLGDSTRQQLQTSAPFHWLELDDARMAELYAAQALYADIRQDDLPGIGLTALLAFLAEKLGSWVQQVVSVEATAPAPRDLPLLTPTPVPQPPSAAGPAANSGHGAGPKPPRRRAPAPAYAPGPQDVHLTVTELVCACLRPGWLAAWRAGQAPSTLPAGGDGVNSHGARLHVLAHRFAEWASDSGNSAAAALAGPQQVLAELMRLGGQRLIVRLIQLNRAAEADKLNLHLQQLAEHFWQARCSCPRFEDWRSVFLAQELSLRRVPMAQHAGRTVWLSGRVDSLRHRQPGGARLVDYKFTPGDAPGEALLQLAVYQRMLHLQHRLEADGQAVFLSPPGSTVAQDAQELNRRFEEQARPVLNELLGLNVGMNVGLNVGITPVPPVSSPAPQAVPPQAAPPQATPHQFQPPQDSLHLGVRRHHPHPAVHLPLLDLARHSAILGSSGSGKTTAALHLIEQVLEQGVPVILLDRKGDLARYAQAEAWQDPNWPPGPHKDAARRARLHQRLAISVFTPGSIQGRGLRLPLAPSGLDSVADDDRDEIARDAAAAFAGSLNLTKVTDQPKQAVLVRVFQILARRISGRGISLDDVLNLLAGNDPDLENAIGVLDPKLCFKLAEQVETFRINSGKLLDTRAEALDWTQWLAPRSDGRIPLTIVSTKFLGDDTSTLFWVAQFFLELLRHVSRNPSSRLQGLLMIDEADLYMPATKSPATKAPLAGLLRRARSAGVGLMLCTQSPGDLDYKGRDNIRNWLIGLIQQSRALQKLEGVLADSRIQPEQISKQKVGQFIFAAEGQAQAVDVPPNLVKTQQLSEPEILQVARQSRLGATVQPG